MNHNQNPAPLLLIVRGLEVIIFRSLPRMDQGSDILQRFGNRVRELRTRHGYSQENFAAECDLDRTYIGGIERGERNVALRNIGRIAETLGISVSDLLKSV